MGGINGYFLQLQALQPPGSALPRDTESVWSRLLGALSDELERVENRSEALVRESDPRTTEEMLTDWERVCGLPDECDPDSTSAPIVPAVPPSSASSAAGAALRKSIFNGLPPLPVYRLKFLSFGLLSAAFPPAANTSGDLMKCASSGGSR